MDRYIIIHRDGMWLNIRIEINDRCIFSRQFNGYTRREAENIARKETNLQYRHLIRVEW